MSFVEAMRNEGRFTRTENGAVALNTTGNACLDLFASIGALRDADENRVISLFSEAYKEDRLSATRILFYARDIREGLGERKTFRTILRYAADHCPEAISHNLIFIGEFGRYDDLYSLIGTKLENNMWATMKVQFENDLKNMHCGNAISLLAKWIKTADASSENTRKLGILTAQKLGYPVYNFKRIVRCMRKHIGVVEGMMSTGHWDEIDYQSVPSRSMKINRNAFKRHDQDRYEDYISSVEKGEVKINASTLYPYDIVGEYMYKRHDEDRVLEAQWKALPDYIEEGTNAIVMADTSGSMTWNGGRPMATAVGLAIYFAERNIGEYHDVFMTFSENPAIIQVRGETLHQKVKNTMNAPWGSNTNLKAAFDKVLDIALKGNVSADEMPKAIIVISDMEIDRCGDREWSFYDKMEKKFKKNGYTIPNIIFWNVNSRHDIFHADASRKGVQLVSGQSASVFKHVMENLGYDPVEAMKKVIGSDRYSYIMVEEW